MNRRDYFAVLGIGIAGTAGCTSIPTGFDPTESEPTESNELIRETYEGDGSALNEFSVENEGAILFEVESDDRLSADVIPADEDGSGTAFTIESRLSRIRKYSDIETGEYALDVTTNGEWKIIIEQHPPLGLKSVETPEFPLTISSETPDVFGPYNFDGFMSASTYSTAVSGLNFIDESGEWVESVGHGQTHLGETRDQGTINVEGPHWLVVTMNLALTGDDDPVEFEVTLEAPS
ncbi:MULTISPECIES: hypothetical protein [Haloferacaceae]|uniref:Uncharacterized protein n=2 Tax=Haloferacaceae TaxID=1644056 RepID=A0ABD6C4Z1_9EURY|nr:MULTISPECIES: hypothetical protein [Haloferacales]